MRRRRADPLYPLRLARWIPMEAGMPRFVDRLDRFESALAEGRVDEDRARRDVTGRSYASERVAQEVDRRADEVISSLFDIALNEDSPPNARVKAIELMLKISTEDRHIALMLERQRERRGENDMKQRALETLERLAVMGKLPEGFAAKVTRDAVVNIANGEGTDAD